MFRNLFALFLVSTLAPLHAYAESAKAPCNLVDQEALIALNLGDHTMKMERKEMPGKNGAPATTVYICTYKLLTAPIPSLSVTSVEIPGAQSLKPSCFEIPGPSVEMSICSAVVRNTYATFSLATKPSPSIPTKNSFPENIERLIKRLATPTLKEPSTSK